MLFIYVWWASYCKLPVGQAPGFNEKLSFRKSRFCFFQFHFNALGISCGVNWTFGGSGSVHQVMIISNNQTGVCILDRISL